jgi:hypothetical protein
VDERTQVTMYPDDDYPGQWIAEVYQAGEPADQMALGPPNIDYLVERTDWDLTLNSDDDPEYVVALLIKTRK